MPKFSNPGAFFVGGTLAPSEQKFLKALLENAKKNGYERFVEPCSGMFPMSHLAVQAGFKPTNDVGYTGEEPWVQLTDIFGSGAVPQEAADVIRQAVKKMTDDGQITSKNKWQAIEYMAAEYLAGN